MFAVPSSISMLSDAVEPGNRPRPPAKARNSTGIGPPPPYNRPRHVRTTSLLGKSISVPAGVIDWDDDKETGEKIASVLASAEEEGDWLDDSTRQELAQILLKADGIIKERENGT